ncbi:hypothetical protein LZ554_004346 [Drepanopeziza brunnea f. sp. 'monogermtubi']|nr:hypothetical protein LZ554_004346 [Drepanopeziza brunnea f. sp. 'monogermtubi']
MLDAKSSTKKGMAAAESQWEPIKEVSGHQDYKIPKARTQGQDTQGQASSEGKATLQAVLAHRTGPAYKASFPKANPQDRVSLQAGTANTASSQGQLIGPAFPRPTHRTGPALTEPAARASSQG